MLRRNDDSVLRAALDLEVSGKRKQGSPKKTWKKQELQLFCYNIRPLVVLVVHH